MVGKKALTGAIAGIVVGTASILLADALGAIDLGDIARSIASAGREAMAIHVPMWGVLLVTFLLFVAVSVHLALVIYRRPGWLDFTKMTHEGRLFKWSYDEDAEPVDIVESCVECEYELDGNKCPMCGWSHWDISKTHVLRIFSLPFRMELKKMIKWHIEKGTYRDEMGKLTKPQKQGRMEQ